MGPIFDALSDLVMQFLREQWIWGVVAVLFAAMYLWVRAQRRRRL